MTCSLYVYTDGSELDFLSLMYLSILRGRREGMVRTMMHLGGPIVLARTFSYSLHTSSLVVQQEAVLDFVTVLHIC